MKGIICSLFILFSINCLAQFDGKIDSSFGNSGTSLSNLLFGGYAKKIRIDSSGKIITAGTIYSSSSPDYDFGSIKFNSDGSIDNSFGQSGYFIYDFGYEDNCNSMCIQQDDKIILGGYSKTIISFNPIITKTNFALVRLTSTGLLDTTFNHTGTLEINYQNVLCAITNIAIQSDGKIVAIGTYNPPGIIQFCALRINSDGSIDSTFGSNGLVNFQFENVYKNDWASCIAIQPDNKILIGGNSNMPFVGKVMAICRLNSDGTFDNTFGNGGKILTDIPNQANDFASSINLQNDGKILLAGTTSNNKIIAIIKYDSSGLLDNDFGSSGIQLLDLSNGNDVAFDLLTQIDSKLILVGYSDTSAYILRLKNNGVLDSTFNNTGINFFGNSASNEGFYSVVQDVQNRLLVGGFIFDSLQKQQFSVVAFNSILFNSINSTEAYISDLKIYPNPSNSCIKFLNLVPNSIVSITDLSGKIQMQTYFNSNQELQISNLPSGIYFIQAKSSNTIQRVKFIRQ